MNNTFDMNVSPVEGKTFAACSSMQHVQLLTGCGGVNKCACECMGKIDEQNHVVVHVDGRGQLVTKGQFLHNAKMSASKKMKTKLERNNRTQAILMVVQSAKMRWFIHHWNTQR